MTTVADARDVTDVDGSNEDNDISFNDCVCVCVCVCVRSPACGNRPRTSVSQRSSQLEADVIDGNQSV